MSQPTENQIKKMTMQLKENMDILHKPLNDIRKKIDWMDAITYEDVRKLHRTNTLDDANIKRILTHV
jgi:hypothetical protein